MNGTVDVPRNLPRGSLTRAAGFFAFWLILAGVNPADLPAGALAARHVRLDYFREEGDVPLGGGWSRIGGGPMTFALDIVTIAAVSAGVFFFLAGTVGLLRFPKRCHI